MAYTHSRYKKPAPLDVQIVDTPKANVAIERDVPDDIATIHQDIKKAEASGDFHAQSDAYRRLAKAERGNGPVRQTDPIDPNGPDEASQAFQKQINALRQSEAIQKQRQELATKYGLTPNQSAFLHHNPAFPNHPEVAKRALMAAHAEGHPDDSDAFHASVHRHFHREIGTIHSDKLVEQGSMRPPEEKAETKPKPRQRRPMDDDDDDLSARGRFVSAPVSRDIPDGRSYQQRSGRVTLTPAQVDMARTLGMSPVEYAKGLLEMRKRDEEFR